jgi:hypothetical protein
MALARLRASGTRRETNLSNCPFSIVASSGSKARKALSTSASPSQGLVSSVVSDDSATKLVGVVVVLRFVRVVVSGPSSRVLSVLPGGVVDGTAELGLRSVPQDVAEKRTRATAVAKPKPECILEDR